ncbi:hypothetical protein Tco_0634929 [Tanacetum coccineum]
MIFKRPVPIPALLCSIGLITNHGHNESDCTVGERKMDCKFFSRLIKDHLSLEPQEIHYELPLREVSFLDQKGLIHMRISVTQRRNDTMQMSVPPILCFKDYPKISTSSSITTLKQKQIGTTSKCFLQNPESDQSSVVGNGAAGNGAQNRAGNANAGQGKLDKMLLMQAQENGAVLDEEELLFLAGEQGNTLMHCDVDDEPTAQTIFMANLSSVGSANPQAGPSNASILSEAKKAQPALYDGDELLKPHHVPVIVPSSKEELELAEATRNK